MNPRETERAAQDVRVSRAASAANCFSNSALPTGISKIVCDWYHDDLGEFQMKRFKLGSHPDAIEDCDELEGEVAPPHLRVIGGLTASERRGNSLNF